MKMFLKKFNLHIYTSLLALSIFGIFVFQNCSQGFTVKTQDLSSNLPSTAQSETLPKITGQPNSFQLSEGANAVFTVTATGSNSLSYQWIKDGVKLVGANYTMLNIAHLTAADTGSYTVVVSNSYGTVSSIPATLVVDIIPRITQQPQAASVNQGGSASFNIGITGTAPLQYQWRKDGVNISGATNSFYNLSDVQVGQAGNYSVIVRNIAGSVTSADAVLSVAPAPVSTVAPSISRQPQPQTLNAGTNASFNVIATGTNPLQYQWQKNGLDIVGATGATYSIANVQASDAAIYSVRIQNVAGSVVSNGASLAITTAPVITQQPLNQSALVGGSASLSVIATGTNPIQYQWMKNGTNISGATSATYSIATVQASDAGIYSVQIKNAAGSIVSERVNLFVTSLNMPADIRTGLLANECQLYSQHLSILPTSTNSSNGFGANITSPSTGQLITNPNLTIQGTCLANIPLVLYSLYSPGNGDLNQIIASSSPVCENGKFQVTVTLLSSFLTSQIKPFLIGVRTANPWQNPLNPFGSIGFPTPITVYLANPTAQLQYTTINSAQDFINMLKSPYGYFVLGKDIDMAGQSGFSPAIYFSSTFSGILDGNGHKLLNLTVVGSLFGTFNGYLTNLQFENSKVTPDGISANNGLIAGLCNDATFNNVIFNGVNIKGTSSTGILCGEANRVTALNVKVTNAIVDGNGGSNIGGFFGVVTDGVTSKLNFSGSVNGGRGAASSSVGGIAGTSWNGCFDQSVSSGQFYSSNTVGSLFGNFGLPDFAAVVVPAPNIFANLFKVSATAAAYYYPNFILNSQGSGTVVANLFSGGAVGQANASYISNTSFQGTIRNFIDSDLVAPSNGVALGFSCKIGGLVGTASGTKILNSSANANITGQGSLSGLLQFSVNSFVYNSSASGQITFVPYTGNASTSGCSDGFSGFTNVINPAGFDGKSPQTAYDTGPGGSVTSGASSTIQRDSTVPVKDWAAHLNTFTAAPSGGDNLQWQADQ